MTVSWRWGMMGAVAALIAGGAGLRAVFLRYPYIDSDQAVIGLMGIHILRGEFPIYFWGEPYSGTLESYVAALLFLLFGVSRLSLNLAPFLFSLVFLFVTWRLGRAIYDRSTGLLGLAVAAFPPMLLTWHSVLARGNYIENLVFGNVLFLLALKLTRPEIDPNVHCRFLWLYGFVTGFAWYMSFQSIHYLVTSALFLLWRGRRGLLVRQAWVAIVAALIGSLPFWLYNLSSRFFSFDAIRWYAHGASLPDALSLFASVKLPIVLGARSFPYNYEPLVTRQIPSLEWVIVGLYGMSFLLALVAIAHPRFRAQSDRWRGVEMLLFLALLVGAITVVGGFGAGFDPRYLLPLYTAAPLLLAALVRAITHWSRVLTVMVLGVVLFSNLYGNHTTAEGLPRYQLYLDNDRALLDQMKERGLKYAFSPEFWFSYRLTFDARESIIVATPFWRDYPREVSKYPVYTRLVTREGPSAYILWGGANPIEQTLRAAGERYEKTVVGRLTLFHDFKPRRSGGRSLSAAVWRLREGDRRDAFDRDPTTRWRGEVSDPLVLDLGQLSTLVQISVHLGEESLRDPHALQVEVSQNESDWKTVISTGPLIPGFVWVEDRLILEDHGRVGLAFPRVPARYLKIQPAPGSRHGRWAVEEVFVYVDGDEVPPPRTLWKNLFMEDPEVESRALLDSLRAILAMPDLEAAYIRFRVALLNLNLPLERVAIADYLATRLAREGRWKEAITFYRYLVEHQAFRSRYWHELGVAYEALGLTEEAKSLEAEARRRFTPAVASGMSFGGTLRLLGHRFESSAVPQGGSLGITLIWETLGAPRTEYAVFIHVIGGQRRVFGQDQYLFDGYFPTWRWERGERIRKENWITIPPTLPAGQYEVIVGVWDPKSREHLRVWQGWLPNLKKSVPLGEFSVVPARQDGGA